MKLVGIELNKDDVYILTVDGGKMWRSEEDQIKLRAKLEEDFKNYFEGLREDNYLHDAHLRGIYTK